MGKSKQLKNTLGLQRLSADPAAENAGEMYFNTTTGKTRVYDGSTWADQGSGSGGGPAGLDSVTDIVDYNVFDSLVSLTGFTTTGTVVLQTTNPINGAKSVSIAPSSSLKKTVTIPAKYAGKKLAIRMVIRSTASYGNVNVALNSETPFVSIANLKVPTGSVPFIANTTASNNQLSSVTNLTPRVGMQVTGGSIPANTLITALSPLTLSNQAGSTASSVALRASDIAQPQVLQFDVPDNCTSLSWNISVAAEAGVETIVDDVMLLYVPQIQQAFTQESDTCLRIVGFQPAQGATATKILSFLTNATIAQNIGNGIQYVDDAALGARFIALKEGLFTFTFSNDMNASAGTALGYSLNSQNLTTNWSGIPVSEKISVGYEAGPGTVTHAVAEVYLKVGDIVRPHIDGSLSGSNTTWSTFTVASEGKLKQTNIASDQKLDIPTHELRFEGSSTRGTGSETAIVKYDAIAFARGDAFTVDQTNGTTITMTKAGKLDIGAYFSNAISATAAQITRNQTVRTAESAIASEILCGRVGSGAAGVAPMLNWSGTVQAGDQIRVASGINPLASVNNVLNLCFQETKVQVSVSNTLPQFSESDSESRVRTGNGFGSTNTSVRRFSNIQQNLGSSITYADSATLGGSWTINEDGEYDIIYMEQTLGTSFVENYITLNSATTASSTIIGGQGSGGTTGALFSAPFSGKLSRGDVIRALVSNTANITLASPYAQFTIVKKGKPNVTGIDVTPFVNIKTDMKGELHATGFSGQGSTNTGVARFTTIQRQNTNGIFAFVQDAALGDYIVVLKKAYITGNYSRPSQNVSNQDFVNAISVNTTVLTAALIGTIPQNQLLASTSTGAGSGINVRGGAGLGFSRSFEVGDIIRCHDSQIQPNFGGNNLVSLTLTAVAEADTVITPVTSFSTDTTQLVQKTTALDTNVDAIGTFVTYKKAINTSLSNTICTTAPTQTIADMALNGIRLMGTAYNAASTDAAPSGVEIYIGKGLKGWQINGYAVAGKTGPCQLDYIQEIASETGAMKSYDESTGILRIDMGSAISTGNTSRVVYRTSNLASIAQPYFTVSASKSPTLAVNIKKKRGFKAYRTGAATIAVSPGTYLGFEDVRIDDFGWYNTSTGEFTIREAGRYRVDVKGLLNSSVLYAEIQLNNQNVSYGFISALGAYNTELIDCKVGDVIRIRFQAGASAPLNVGAGNYNSLIITKEE